MHTRSERVMKAKLKMSLKLKMESSFGSLSKLHNLFGANLRTSSMKLIKRLAIVFSSNKPDDFELILNGFEVQRDMVTL